MATKENQSSTLTKGICRRYPPQVAADQYNISYEQPEVWSNDWCGEYKFIEKTHEHHNSKICQVCTFFKQY